MSARTTARAIAAGATTLALIGGLVVGAAGPAHARKKKPSKPTAVTAIGSTPTSMTVHAQVRYGKRFRVYAAPTAREVNSTSYRDAPYQGSSRTPTVVLAGLAYRTEPYFLRYTAKNSRGMRFSEIASAYLTPPVPTGLTAVTTAGGGLALRWSTTRAAERYLLTAATDPSFTQGVRTFTLSGEAHSFTPPGLTPGAAYWFRVRAANGPSASPSTASVSATAPVAGVAVRLASYNLLWSGADGSKAGDGVVAPWSKRRDAAAALLHSAAPDVIAVQEGNTLVGNVRQVDSLVAALGDRGDSFVVADTEGATRTGPYVVYRSSVWTAVGAGGRYSLGNGRYAAYQVLEHRASGARVLVTSSHLTPGTASTDDERRAETASLAAQATYTAAAYDLPVVYAGDFNSNGGRNHAVDSPTVVFDARGVPDSKPVSPTVVNGRYNSANQYYRTPLASSLDIDHIFVEPGIAVTRFQTLLRLDRDGDFDGVIPSDHNPIVADLLLPTG